MKVLNDYHEFRRRTKPVLDDLELEIKPDSGLGMFSPARLDELKLYCLDHPEYHIMSLLPFLIKINRPMPFARYYVLAEGDADPELMYFNPVCRELFELSEVQKFERD